MHAMGLACSASFYGYLFCFCTHLIINRTLIIIRVFIKRKILSIEPVLSTHTRIHTEAPAHTSILNTKLNVHSLKRAANGDKMDEDSSTEQKTWQVYSFGKS